MQNYRDPPPYPGHSKQVYPNQPGFRQSFSGSETSTDVSLSSTENLATSQRQEPQGEETQSSFNYNLDVGGCDGSSYSILERLGMPPGALDSVGKLPTSGSANSLNALPSFYQERSQLWYQGETSTSSTSLGLSSSSQPLYSKGHLGVPQWQITNMQTQMDRDYTARGMTPTGDYVSSSHPTDVTSSSTHGLTTRPGEYGSYSSTSQSKTVTEPVFSLQHLTSSSSNQYLSPRVPPVSTYHHPHPYVNAHWTVGSGDSSSSSHSSLTAFSHSSLPRTSPSAAASTHSGHTTPVSYLNSLPPPPEYPGNKTPGLLSDKSTDIRPCRSYETMDMVNIQRSHPDLRLCASSPGLYTQDAKYQSTHGSGSNSADDTDQVTIAAKASHMVEMLTDENRVLREELATYAIRVAKLQKFEREIQKVHESHKALLKSVEKREALWLAMKRKLEEKIQTLESQTSSNTAGQMPVSTTESEFRNKLAEKDSMISKLLSQNQEMSLNRDEMEGENTQLTLTITELKAHVEIFENALLAAQTKVLTLEEEKHVSKEKFEQLQKALTTMQTASDKQEKKERDMRALLEKELEMYRAQERGGIQRKCEAGKDDVKGSGTLRKMLDEKDAKILQLETELAAMEQKFVKETTLRQLNLGEATKEARLTSLDKGTSEVGKLIDEAKTEKLKHMEELHYSQKNVAELEARVKQLQTQMVEKEALLKIFQRAPLAMARSSSLHALCHSPLHSPRPSLLSSHVWPGSGQGIECTTTSSSAYREFATIRHMKTGSAGAVELGHKISMEEDLLSKVQNLNTETKSESDDEVKLWHV